MPPLRNPIVADLAPAGAALTKYHEEHAVTYVRMLDADADGVGQFRHLASRPFLLARSVHLLPAKYPSRKISSYDIHLGKRVWRFRIATFRQKGVAS